ncbi:MAG TPA: type I DNA topoisomerase [Vicinamibacterales bacterium]|nr:type I DNA topoisomerase [Vicinamibacterales bacterium]
MAKPLVIVESPAKAKTLARFLGRAYQIEASFGHVRDLPEKASEVPAEIREKSWSRLAVDVEGDFTPYYVIPAGKKKQVQALRAAVKQASELLLATDPDREGESISWHLREVLKPRIPVRRIVFHEITEGAVKEAVRGARDLDENLVRAQEARRILDRLYGYTLSPVLWKKVGTGLSAGRVQSVAVRLLVEREEARRAFRSSRYWGLEAALTGGGRPFTATLVRIGGQRLATSRDFDAGTGALAADGVRLLDEAQARELAGLLAGTLPWTVTSVEARPGLERPAPPFTTSTLSQEASRKLGFSTERTMQVAQRLFQGKEIGGGEIEGLITYHRTDSTTLSEKAMGESARVIRELFGADYYAGPRRYQTRVKNAQEAHEAIRPTDFRLAPRDLERFLDADELRLYDLVWKRTVASQMADARVLKTSVEITAAGPAGEPCVFSASGKAIEFAGFRRAYVEGSDDPDADLADQESILPPMREGDLVVGPGPSDAAPGGTGIALTRLEAKGHETQPPARFTEAALIRELEQAGIGRPSTYATTIATIERRGYVFRQGKALVPTFSAFAVTNLLRDHFGDYVDVGFTAEMEEDLDEISNGERDAVSFIRAFYRDGDGGHAGLEPTVEKTEPSIEYPAIEIGADPVSGEPLRVRVGRYGPFVQRGEGGPGNTATLPRQLPPADLTVEKAIALLTTKAEGPKSLGVDPATGLRVYVHHGRFGHYVQLGEHPPRAAGKAAEKPKRASIPGGAAASSITLDDALRLLSLPRELGPHPSDGEPVVAAVGRFGPYVKHGDEFRSLEDSDDVYTVSLERALDLLKAPKKSRRRAAATTLRRQLGAHPQTGAEVRLMEGRYGPYVTDGHVNASVPKTADASQVTLDDAVALLKARAEAGPAARKGAARAAGRAKRRAGKQTGAGSRHPE